MRVTCESCEGRGFVLQGLAPETSDCEFCDGLGFRETSVVIPEDLPRMERRLAVLDVLLSTDTTNRPLLKQRSRKWAEHGALVKRIRKLLVALARGEG